MLISRSCMACVAIALGALIGLGAAQSAVGTQYRAVYGWEKMPAGRKLGVVTGVIPDPDGKHMWVLDRCGANNCAGTNIDPILKFDLDGNLVKSFGGGIFAWPHGFFRDADGNFWVTEGSPATDARGEAGRKLGKGHEVFKLSPEGKVLMTLGTAGVAGSDATHFNGPSGVAVAKNGDIWIVDGHRDGNNRMVRFSKDGRFIKSWGGGPDATSAAPGLFNDPHHITIDSEGRLFVSDRENNRIEIFDGEGNFLTEWKQFGRPSAIYIDKNDTIYVADGMSGAEHNLGWNRAIRIGDAKTGRVDTLIPDNQEYGRGQSGVEFLATDPAGTIYAGEVTHQRLVKYIPTKP